MSIPIVFIHRGWGSHLEVVLEQAKRSNPNTKIYLITDSTNPLPDQIIRVNLLEVFEVASHLNSIYVHISDQAQNYELFCIQRWFVLLEFMTKFNFQQAFALDTDVLLFGDITAQAVNYHNCHFTLSSGHGCHVVYINSIQTLIDFSVHVFKIFELGYEKLNQALMIQHWLAVSGIDRLHIALNDMWLFRSFVSDQKYLVGDTRIPISGSVFDSCLSRSDGFEMEDGIKKIFWRNKLPFGILESSKEFIKFNSLHFQGAQKELIIPWSKFFM
jgi:hypothetical protein